MAILNQFKLAASSCWTPCLTNTCTFSCQIVPDCNDLGPSILSRVSLLCFCQEWWGSARRSLLADFCWFPVASTTLWQTFFAIWWWYFRPPTLQLWLIGPCKVRKHRANCTVIWSMPWARTELRRGQRALCDRWRHWPWTELRCRYCFRRVCMLFHWNLSQNPHHKLAESSQLLLPPKSETFPKGNVPSKGA